MPFVYLTAFEPATAEERGNMTPETIDLDEPETFKYDDPIQILRALAQSYNLATIHVAQLAGSDIVKSWKDTGLGNVPKPYPTSALGVFKATPYEIATAHATLQNMSVLQLLSPKVKIVRRSRDITQPATSVQAKPRRASRRDTAFLTDIMRSRINNEGTGNRVRAASSTLDAPGKTGTTNELRDAWVVGSAPEPLTVVSVGFDDDQPAGPSGRWRRCPSGPSS